ncbi:hypothetical protein O3G_MSEX000846 [Manduca sexta]|nr:hypothetical protein O3G_MSEX000846 [Manduca sexta]
MFLNHILKIIIFYTDGWVGMCHYRSAGPGEVQWSSLVASRAFHFTSRLCILLRRLHQRYSGRHLHVSPLGHLRRWYISTVLCPV